MLQKPKSKEGWAGIPWRAIESYVFKIQKRIYSASLKGEIIKVRKLQNTLVDSYFSKMLATRRVTQDNSGKRTAGIDGIRKLKPVQRLAFAQTLHIFTRPKPLRRIWIEKQGKTELRPLGIPVLSDRGTQALFKLALEPEWEAKFEPNSYGFRPGRNTHDAIKQIYLSINKKPKYVLDADIRKCFDRIDHEKLLIKLGFIGGRFPKQLRAWLKSGVMDNSVFQDTLAGTPLVEKGGIISPLLANVALHGMENMLKDLMDSIKLRTPKGSWMGNRDKRRSLSVVRYADDFVVMHYDKEVVLKCREAIENFLSDIGLELSLEKTRITHTLELSPTDIIEFNLRADAKPGFDFLGFTIRQFKSKYNGGVLGLQTIITPAKGKCLAYQRKLTQIIMGSKTLSQELLLKKLNPIISGWARYFGRSDAATTHIMSKMDYLLYLKLRRWAKRRTKSAASGARKYWRRVGTRKWTFGTKSGINLIYHVDNVTSIKDYVKVIGESSPFNGEDLYWTLRLGKNPLMTRSQIALLQRQKGRCALCGGLFGSDDILEIDHITPLSKGGKKAYENSQLLHRHCLCKAETKKTYYNLRII